MSSPAPVPPPVFSNEEEEQLPLGLERRREGLRDRLRIWEQVLLAELLNLLERRRYDLK